MLKEEQVLGRKKTTNSNLSSCSVTRYEIDNEKLRLTTCVANITKWQINVLFKKKKERQIVSLILSCHVHRRINSFYSALSNRLAWLLALVIKLCLVFHVQVFHGDCTREQRRL